MKNLWVCTGLFVFVFVMEEVPNFHQILKESLTQNMYELLSTYRHFQELLTSNIHANLIAPLPPVSSRRLRTVEHRENAS